MMKKYLIIALFVVAVIFVLAQDKLPSPNENYVELAGQKIKVDVVRTQDEQNKGLSGRKSLASDQGMLFVFEAPGSHPFWMKDMNFPIDIIWFDGEGKVIYIKENARPESYPEVYDPGVDASYVLEVVSGFAQKNNLKVGDEAVFTYQ